MLTSSRGHPWTALCGYTGQNSVLPILAACLLAPGECVIHNCPELSDVAASLDILRHLGCRAERQGDAVVVDASAPTGWDVPDALMREMRSSVIFLGAILGRMGRAELCAPGGCELGPRPIDLHLGAIRGLGGRITEDGGGLRAEGPCGGGPRALPAQRGGHGERHAGGGVRRRHHHHHQRRPGAGDRGSPGLSEGYRGEGARGGQLGDHRGGRRPSTAAAMPSWATAS